MSLTKIQSELEDLSNRFVSLTYGSKFGGGGDIIKMTRELALLVLDLTAEVKKLKTKPRRRKPSIKS
jgi:hypothetical protein